MPTIVTLGAMAARGFGWLYKAVTGSAGYQAWAWGANLSGQLGDGTTTAKSSPIQIGSTADISFITGNNQVLAIIKTDGTLWMVGANNNGQLAQGNTTNRSSPVQVGTETNWAFVSITGVGGVRAIKTNGTLWVWGNNNNGELGTGVTGVNYSSPVQVGALTNWSKASGGNQYSLFLKTDGTMWSVGINSNGQLGLGDTTNRSSPVQIGALTTWASIGNAANVGYAIKNDGTLWSWGANSAGQLGLGDTNGRSSPVQVGTLTTWAKVQPNGTGSSCAAIRTDGTLWVWGSNSQGQLAQNNITNRSSPVQVGTATNWNTAGVNLQLIASTTSGQAWAAGFNSDGQLGIGDTTNRSSPVQIGSSTNWIVAYPMDSVNGIALRS